MRIHSLHHADFETLGDIESWISEKGHSLSSTQVYECTKFPELSSFDWLIIMGGPMGVYEEEKYPWLKEEKRFIKKTIEEGKIVLGICLGSQLIAEVLGSNVFHNNHKEIGWFPVKPTKESSGNFAFKELPQSMLIFHWHGDTYDLPAGAVRLAESEGCRNQAFAVGEKVIGLQFHLEVNEKLLRDMLTHGKNELAENKYIQSEEDILNGLKFSSAANSYLRNILNAIEEHFS